MAKRKLSPQQRIGIRKDIKQHLALKKKQADILRAVAAKYGITTITARWYYKGIVKPRKTAARKPGSVRKFSSRKARRTSRVHVKNGALRLVQDVQSAVEKSLKRALEVKKLIPKWQVYVRKEASLRQLESRLKEQLKTVSSKASALHRRIQSLRG